MGTDAIGKTFSSSAVIIQVGQYRLTCLDANDIKADKNTHAAGGFDMLKRLGRLYIEFPKDKREMVPRFLNFTSDRPLDFTYEVIDLENGDPVGRYINFVDPYQREPMSVLESLLKKQNEYYKANGAYAKTFAGMGLNLTAGARYSYFLSATEKMTNDQSAEFPSNVNEFAPYSNSASGGNGFTIIAIANNDSDPTLDIWTVRNGHKPEALVNDVLK